MDTSLDELQSLLTSKLTQAREELRITNELVLDQVTRVPEEEVVSLASESRSRPSEKYPGFDRFEYNIRSQMAAAGYDSIRVVLDCFHELGFVSTFRVDPHHLAHFVLTVRQGYRDVVPYHNWAHALATLHFSYLLAKNCRLEQLFSDLEIFVTIVSCLCHDIDHKGTNNAFEINTETTLGALYSSKGSVMEMHHLTRTVAILHSPGCNLFSGLSEKDFNEALRVLQNNILATDLVRHFKIIGELKNVARDGYNRSRTRHHFLVLSLIMTSCDLSDQTKDWNSTIEVVERLYMEFFAQGDLEKELGRDPIEMMDREKANIPEQQIGFLTNVAYPVYKLLKHILPSSEPALRAVDLNRRRWKVVRRKMKDICIYHQDRLCLDNVDVSKV